MTPPNEADAKEVASKLLKLSKSSQVVSFECMDGLTEIQPDLVHKVCTRLLELEEHKLHYDRLFISGVLIPSEEYAAKVKDRDSLKAELKAANERCGKLQKSLEDIARITNTTSRHNQIARNALNEALRSPQGEE